MEQDELSYDIINSFSYKEENDIQIDVTKFSKMSTSNDSKKIILDSKNKEIKISFNNNKFDKNEIVIDNNQIVIDESKHEIDNKQKSIDNFLKVIDKKRRAIDKNVIDKTNDSKSNNNLIEIENDNDKNHDGYDKDSSVSPIFFYNKTRDRSLYANKNLVFKNKDSILNCVASKNPIDRFTNSLQIPTVNFDKDKNDKEKNIIKNGIEVDEMKHTKDNHIEEQKHKNKLVCNENPKNEDEKCKNILGSFKIPKKTRRNLGYTMKTWSLDECLMKFDINSDEIDETVVTSIDGWMCNLIQAMEEALKDILKVVSKNFLL